MEMENGDSSAGKTSGLSASDMNLLQLLQLRMKEASAEKETLQYKIQLLDGKIRSAVNTLPRRPNIDDEKVDEQIRKLDFQRETTTLSLTQEKAILRQMEQIRNKRKELTAFRKAEEDLSQLRREKQALQQQLESKESAMTELSSGLQKLQLAERLGIPACELKEIEVPVSEKHAPRVMGRGRSNIINWQQSCKVVMDYQRPKGMIVIQGTIQSINEAKAKIERITLEEREDLEVGEALMTALKLNRYEVLNQLQQKYDVRIDADQKVQKVDISGIPANIAATRQEILDISVSTSEILVDDTIIPAVMGKGGSNFRGIEEEFGVGLNLDRKLGTIKILGRAEGVPGATAKMQELINMNKMKEEVIDLKGSHLISAILGKGGDVIRGLQRDSGARLNLTKSNQDNATLAISGNAHRVDKAVEMVKQVLADLEERTVIVKVPDADVLKAIIGKSGATIKQLRSETDGVVIDLDWEAPAVRLSHEDKEKTMLAKEKIDAIVEKNQHAVILIGKDAATALRMQRGKVCREEVTQEIGASMEIDNSSDEGRIKLRGSTDQLKQAMEKLEAFREMNYTIEVSVFPDDESSLLQGGAESTLQQLQEETGAELRLLRQEHVVLIRGSKEQAEAAKAAMQKILHGDDDGSVIMMAVDKDAMGPVIGKAGKRVKEIQSEFDITVDVLRSRNQLRLRGSPDKVQEAKNHISSFIGGLRITALLKMGKGYKGQYARTVAQEYGVQVEERGMDIRIRGLIQDVADARVRMQELVAGMATCRIQISPEQMATLVNTGETNFRHIKMEHNVSLELDQGAGTLVVRGRPDAVPAAKKATYQMLDIVFQGEFAEVEFPRPALKDMMTVTKIHELEKAHNVHLVPDRQESCVRLRGPPEAVEAACEALQGEIEEWGKTHAIIPVEEWLLPSLIGKGGREVNQLQDSTGVSMDVDRDGLCVLLSGTEDQVADAKTQLSEKIDKLMKENAEIEIDPNAVGNLIGRGGANIRQLQEDTGISIDTDRNSGKLKLRGPEEGIAKAKKMIDDFMKEWTANNYTEIMELGENCARALISRTGGPIREIRDACPNTYIDVNPEDGTVRFQGSSELVAHGKAMITKFAEEYKQSYQPPRRERERGERGGGQGKDQPAKSGAAPPAEPEVEEEVKSSFPVIPVGADPDHVAALKKKKSRRRKGKKNPNPTPAGASPSPTPSLEASNSVGAAPGAPQPAAIPDQGSDEANNLLAMLLGDKPPTQSSSVATQPNAQQTQQPNATNNHNQEAQEDYYVSNSGFRVRLT